MPIEIQWNALHDHCFFVNVPEIKIAYIVFYWCTFPFIIHLFNRAHLFPSNAYTLIKIVCSSEVYKREFIWWCSCIEIGCFFFVSGQRFTFTLCLVCLWRRQCHHFDLLLSLYVNIILINLNIHEGCQYTMQINRQNEDWKPHILVLRLPISRVPM